MTVNCLTRWMTDSSRLVSTSVQDLLRNMIFNISSLLTLTVLKLQKKKGLTVLATRYQSVLLTTEKQEVYLGSDLTSKTRTHKTYITLIE